MNIDLKFPSGEITKQYGRCMGEPVEYGISSPRLCKNGCVILSIAVHSLHRHKIALCGRSSSSVGGQVEALNSQHCSEEKISVMPTLIIIGKLHHNLPQYWNWNYFFHKCEQRANGNIEISPQNIVKGFPLFTNWVSRNSLLLNASPISSTRSDDTFIRSQNRNLFLHSAHEVVYLLLLASNSSWDSFLAFKFWSIVQRGTAVAQWLRCCATNR